ncbi:MAG: hypothetical protein ACXWLR_02585 [Myxococcales bacterium]
MSPELSDDAREMLQHFADLPEADRGRILALVRNLSFCRTAELYSTAWPDACSSRVTQGGAPPSSSTQRSPV